MRTWLVSAVVMLVACGSSNVVVELVPAGELAIVAHATDELVLLGPERTDAVRRGAGVTTIYVTAGDAGTADDVDRQIDGLKVAYQALTGDDDWACGWIRSGDTQLQHCRLASARVSLVFVGYPGGGPDGAAATSLLNLWEANVASVETIARRPSTVSQTELIRVLAELIDVTAPATLRTLEVAATHGRDHSDHMLVGALAVLATAASSAAPALRAYRGDNIADEPLNIDVVTDGTADAVARYAACATGCAPCGGACGLDELGPEQARALGRSYPVAMRATAAGQLRQGTSCVTVTTEGANAALAPCATAPTWQLDDHGRLRASTGLCLRALFTGEIIATACGDDGVGGRFFLDDDGHLWSGQPPTPADDMALAHLSCLTTAGGRPRLALCGAGRAPTWHLAP